MFFTSKLCKKWSISCRFCHQKMRRQLFRIFFLRSKNLPFCFTFIIIKFLTNSQPGKINKNYLKMNLKRLNTLPVNKVDLQSHSQNKIDSPYFRHQKSQKVIKQQKQFFNMNLLSKPPNKINSNNTSQKDTYHNDVSFSNERAQFDRFQSQKSPRTIKLRRMKSSQAFFSQKNIKNDFMTQSAIVAQLKSNNFSSVGFMEWCLAKQNKKGTFKKQQPLNSVKEKVLQVKQTIKNPYPKFIFKADISQSESLASFTDFGFANMNIKMFGLGQGHGEFGPKILKYLKRNIIQKIKQKINIQNDRQKLIKSVFKKVFQQMCKKYGDELLYSGVTTTFCILEGDDLYTINIGNNKALIGYTNARQNNQWTACQASYDHYLSQECEHMRIMKNHGKIMKTKSTGKQTNNLRVWAQHEGKVYGINTTRSFGDISLAESGIIPIPDINNTRLKPNHKIIFIGQEPIYQFFTKDEIIQTCSFYYRKNKSVIEASKQLNKQLERLAPADQWSKQDFGFVLVFLD